MPKIYFEELFSFEFDVDYDTAVIFYREDNNQFSTLHGDIIYNIYDFLRPHQIFNFKNSGEKGMTILTKQGRWIDIIHI